MLAKKFDILRSHEGLQRGHVALVWEEVNWDAYSVPVGVRDRVVADLETSEFTLSVARLVILGVPKRATGGIKLPTPVRISFSLKEAPPI